MSECGSDPKTCLIHAVSSAKDAILDEVDELIHNLMGQGERLEEYLRGNDDEHDDVVFAYHEAALRYYRNVIDLVPSTIVYMHLEQTEKGN